MLNFIIQHSTIICLGFLYVIVAAVNALPDPAQTFHFYPWFYHTAKSLMNAVPPQYTQRIQSQETKIGEKHE